MLLLFCRQLGKIPSDCSVSAHVPAAAKPLLYLQYHTDKPVRVATLDKAYCFLLNVVRYRHCQHT